MFNRTSLNSVYSTYTHPGVYGSVLFVNFIAGEADNILQNNLIIHDKQNPFQIDSALCVRTDVFNTNVSFQLQKRNEKNNCIIHCICILIDRIVKLGVLAYSEALISKLCRAEHWKYDMFVLYTIRSMFVSVTCVMVVQYNMHEHFRLKIHLSLCIVHKKVLDAIAVCKFLFDF